LGEIAEPTTRTRWPAASHASSSRCTSSGLSGWNMRFAVTLCVIDQFITSTSGSPCRSFGSDGSARAVASSVAPPATAAAAPTATRLLRLSSIDARPRSMASTEMVSFGDASLVCSVQP